MSHVIIGIVMGFSMPVGVLLTLLVKPSCRVSPSFYSQSVLLFLTMMACCIGMSMAGPEQSHEFYVMMIGMAILNGLCAMLAQCRAGFLSGELSVN